MPKSERNSKQHPVPQNVLDVEFKVVSGLTMRQFFYTLVTLALTAMVYNFSPSLLALPLAGAVFIIGAGIAFAKIEERNLDDWIVNFFMAVFRPTQYLWKKEPTIPKAFSYESIRMVQQEMITLAPTTSRRKLEDYLTQTKVEEIDPFDIDTGKYVDKLERIYATMPKQQMPAAPLPEPEPYESEQKPQETPQNFDEIEEKQEQAPENKETSSYKNKIKGLRLQYLKNKTKTKPTIPQGYVPKDMTPDRTAGRVFNNLNTDNVDIVLPIRGEKVLQSTTEQRIDEQIQQKAERLKKLLENISKKNNIEQPVASGTPKNILNYGTNTTESPTESIETATISTIEAVEKKSEELEQKLKEAKIKQNEIVQKELEQQKQEAEDNIKELSKQLASIETTLEEKAVSERTVKPVQKQLTNPKAANIQPLTDKPNVITGTVINSNSAPVPGAIVIIKNDKNEPVRAIKTNSLGQFKISAPLSNGKYIIEVDKARKTNYVFDIIGITLNDSVLPPIEIKGKLT
jgi:hypothetical protein